MPYCVIRPCCFLGAASLYTRHYCHILMPLTWMETMILQCSWSLIPPAWDLDLIINSWLIGSSIDDLISWAGYWFRHAIWVGLELQMQELGIDSKVQKHRMCRFAERSWWHSPSHPIRRQSQISISLWICWRGRPQSSSAWRRVASPPHSGG